VSGPRRRPTHDEVFAAFARIVEDREGFPQEPPLSRRDFDDYWLAHTSTVMVARSASELAGAYYLRRNFVGRAAHVANGGYFVVARFRGSGLGRRLVLHSLDEAKRLGFDAMQFNLVLRVEPGWPAVRGPRLPRCRPGARCHRWRGRPDLLASPLTGQERGPYRQLDHTESPA
jgi:GNAT superfamily N-acetyltransferase